MTTTFDERLIAIKTEYQVKQKRLSERKLELQHYEKTKELYLNRAKALQYIVLLSDDNTSQLRTYIESVINRALDLIFGQHTYKFSLVSDLRKQTINLELLEYKQDHWMTLDINNQTGDGMGQIIAFLFSVVLTEITNHRMLFVVDEVMGGLHEKAVELVKRCITEFSKHGANFALIEYTFEDFGREYLLEYDKSTDTTNIAKTTDHGLIAD